jgi:hypothetical protein
LFVFIIKHHEGDKIKEYELTVHVARMRGLINICKILARMSEGRDYVCKRIKYIPVTGRGGI